MKYLTKEWYWWNEASAWNKEFHKFEVDARVSICSEELFHELYEKAEQKWLSMWNSREEEISKRIREKNGDLSKFRHEIMFQPLQVKKVQFKEHYEFMLRRCSGALTDELRQVVADTRLFALGYVTEEALRIVDRYAKECRENIERTCQKEANVRQGLFIEHEPVWLKDFDFHDEIVESAHVQATDFILKFKDGYGGFGQYKKVIFQNANILERDEPLIGAYWLCEEVYPLEKGYEIHVLLSVDLFFEPLYLTLICDDVQYMEEKKWEYGN